MNGHADHADGRGAVDGKYLDDLNNKRVETTKLRVAHAIRLVTAETARYDDTLEFELSDEAVDRLVEAMSHAVNLLEAANEEMKFACEHFEWDSKICSDVDEAICVFGRATAILLDEHLDDDSRDDCVFIAKEGVIKLSTVLASLVRWFDDTQDISEI